MKWIVKHKKKMIITAIGIYLIIVLTIILSGLRDQLFKADLIVVLGTTVSPEGIPSDGLAARLDKAYEIFEKGYSSHILVSGGTGKEGFDESVAMANYLIAKGIPETAIIKDGKGVNTRATAHNTYTYMRKHQLTSVIIVSQYYHIARIRLAFKAKGIKNIGQASPAYTSWIDFYAIFRELLGYPIYLFKIK